MNIIIYSLVFLVLLKYFMILLGYLSCYIVTKVLKRKSMKEGYNSKQATQTEEIINKKKEIYIHIADFIHGYMRYSLMWTSKIPCHFVRNLIYKYIYHLGMDKYVVIYGGAEIRHSYKISIGEGTIIGDDAKLDARNGIMIGKNVNFSTGVWIWTEQHNPQASDFSCVNEGGPVIIGDRAWLSSRVTVLPGVKIGEGAVVAANAVVTKDIEPYSIYGGIPAKKIGERNKNLTYEFKGEYLPFY